MLKPAKTIAQRSALFLTLMLLTVPASRIYAQPTVSPSAVTGGDPQPPGEPPPKKTNAASSVLIAVLIAVGLA